MHRIDNSTAEAGKFTEGDPTTGKQATIVDKDWLNAVQESISKTIELAGISLVKGNDTQLHAAILELIADNAGGGGGGGSGSGEQVKVTEAILGASHSNTTVDNQAIAGLQVNYTPVASANDRFIDVFLDWIVKDIDAADASGYAVLQKSANGSTWTDLKTLTNKIVVPPGGGSLVKTDKFSLNADISTTSDAFQDSGLQLDYTAIGAANKRIVSFFLNAEVNDPNGGVANQNFKIQYNSGSGWTDVPQSAMTNKTRGIFEGSSNQEIPIFFQFIDTASDATPQYRVVHKISTQAGDPADTSTIKAGSYIAVEEYSPVVNSVELQQNISLTIRDTDDTATPYYRIAHRVDSGDESIIVSGSFLRVREFN